MDKYAEWIEKYLMNEMSAKEEAEFNELLLSNKELNKEFKLRLEIDNAICEAEIIDLRNKLDEIVNPSKLRFNISKRAIPYFSVAAIVIVGFLINCIRLSRTHDQTGGYEVYPAIATIRSIANDGFDDQLLYMALNSYDEKEYKKAANYFSDVLKLDSANNMAQFYLAICKIENSELNEAEAYLLDLILRENHIFSEQSHWYLAQVRLLKDDTAGARNVLNEMVRQEMVFKDAAKKILRSLD